MKIWLRQRGDYVGDDIDAGKHWWRLEPSLFVVFNDRDKVSTSLVLSRNECNGIDRQQLLTTKRRNNG